MLRLGISAAAFVGNLPLDDFGKNVTLSGSTTIGDLRSSINRLFAVIDASGKPGAGFLRGNTVARGLQSQCENIEYKPADASPFNGQLVIAILTLDLPGQSLAFYWDFCLPAECDSEEIQWLLSQR